ncbi:MAG TPA: hypothetical protein VFQ30_20510, partial [Ktedonobacteraceae bacterium]|nr:hypothetical protein [Ktedonobacteraceae bacterium]
ENVKAGIISHEQRLATYRQNLQRLPVRGEPIKEGVRHNPYASESEGDPFLELIVHFAVDMEKTYLRWLYEVLDKLEGRESQYQTEE